MLLKYLHILCLWAILQISPTQSWIKKTRSCMNKMRSCVKKMRNYLHRLDSRIMTDSSLWGHQTFLAIEKYVFGCCLVLYICVVCMCVSVVHECVPFILSSSLPDTFPPYIHAKTSYYRPWYFWEWQDAANIIGFFITYVHRYIVGVLIHLEFPFSKVWICYHM